MVIEWVLPTEKKLHADSFNLLGNILIAELFAPGLEAAFALKYRMKQADKFEGSDLARNQVQSTSIAP